MSVRGKVGAASFVARFVWTHPANRDHRIRRLLSSTSFEIASRVRHHKKLTDVGRSKMWADQAFYSSVLALHGFPPDWNEMHVWKNHLGPGSLFVDVGANIGVYTL